MPKNHDLTKHTLNLRAGDWDYLSEVFASKGYPTSVVVRNTIARFVDNLRKAENQTTPILPLENIDV